MKETDNPDKVLPLYLASASPRRKQLVEQMGLRCLVVRVDADEPMDQDISAHTLAENLAARKMNACREQHPDLFDRGWILTADTLISLDDHKLGKPADREEAGAMLGRLQGRSHQVITAFSIYSPLTRECVTESESTDVIFSPMDDGEIASYLDTGEWRGVAGAYRIQEQGGKYISSIKGCFYNVMGLPINRIYGMLSRLNFSA
jgi:septum formation protein